MITKQTRDREGLALLRDIGALLAETANVDLILAPALERIAGALGIPRGMIAILNRVRGEIGAAEAWGMNNAQIARGHYALGEGITGQVVKTGRPVVVRRVADEPRFLNRTGARDDADRGNLAFLCVPLTLGAEVLGALSVDLPRDAGDLDWDLRLLSAAAAVLAVAARQRQARYEELETLLVEGSHLASPLRVNGEGPGAALIGNAPAMRRLYREMEQVAGTSATVLILGESGTGKERVARALHAASPRRGKPFVTVNCAAIPAALVESTLFGHERGAFTGAAALRRGSFEQADGGTLFLDEIAELPLGAQAKLLRALQEREVERVGGTRPFKVDIRVIAATNRDLAALIAEGAFREDLYFRLQVFPLETPPLRERKSDVMLLAYHFIEKFAAANHKVIGGVSERAVEMLTAYSWPGNVRELENCVERAVLLSTDGVIHSYHLPRALGGPPGGRRRTLKETLEGLERDLIDRELRWTRGNAARAARNLGVSERVMGLRVEKYGLRGRLG